MVPGSPTRRELLRSGGVLGLLATVGCTATDPSVTVPAAALVDESIDVGLSGLGSVSSVLVRASAESRDGERWEARARFDVGGSARLSVPDRAPVEGSYEGVDPMGLFWSMRPADADPDRRLPPETLFRPGASGYDVTVTAEVDGGTVAETTTRRRLFDPGVERRTIDHPDLVGALFVPPGDRPVPAVVHLHGVGGRPHVATARLLASHGFVALALQYFGDPDPVPDSLVEVPVEYVEAAVTWLREHDRVAGPVGLFGFSRGGPLALLAATVCDDVRAVVGWVPSGVVWEGLEPGRVPAGTSAWSVGGDPTPYIELADADPGPPPTPGLPYFEPALSEAGESELAAASVPVEEAAAPILLLSATDDRRWPSTPLSERVVERLGARDYPHRYRHDSNGGAGHYIRLPYLPTAGTTRDARNVYGGSQVANARASSRSWSETLAFLEATLGSGQEGVGRSGIGEFRDQTGRDQTGRDQTGRDQTGPDD